MANGADLENPTWTETINSVVRSLVTLMFGLSVCYGFLFARAGGLTLVSSDAFSTIAMAVILWWFKDRSDKEKAKETTALMAAAAAVPPAASTESAANPNVRS